MAYELSLTPSPRQTNRTPAADHRRVSPVLRRRGARLLAPPRRLGLAPPLDLRRVGGRAVPAHTTNIAGAPGAAHGADLIIIIPRRAASRPRLRRTPPVEGLEAALFRSPPARLRRLVLVHLRRRSSSPSRGAAVLLVLRLWVLHGMRAQGQVRGEALAAGRAAEALRLGFGWWFRSRRRRGRRGRRTLLRLLATTTAVAQRLVGLLELPKFVDVPPFVRVFLEG